ncbi:MAG TPA: hypothetical protein VHS99_02190 [Chloroflexota bacterium]|jgi:pyocin large subunit-like protein|nr:hypothetical protein [Chloroflexota bacterium]
MPRLTVAPSWWLILALLLWAGTACSDALQASAGPAGGSPGGLQVATVTAGTPATEAAATEEAERIARSATWAPGQLQAHFAKHGKEGPYASAEAYDASARETIRVGQQFEYVDRTSRARRRGFYDRPGNRFTAVTADGRRLTTHFRPEDGERYVRQLPQSTYR